MRRSFTPLAMLAICVALVACKENDGADPKALSGETIVSASKSPGTAMTTLSKIKCPAPPEQISRDIFVDAKGKLEGLAALPKASIEGKVSIVSKDLLAKYPNADKLHLATLVMSMTCEHLKNSSTLTDSERLDRVNQLNTQIMNFFTASAAPDFRARAAKVDFGKELMGMVHKQITVSREKSPTLYLFEPTCPVVVYVSTVLPIGEKSPLVSMKIVGQPIHAQPAEELKHRFTVTAPIFKTATDWVLDDTNLDMMARPGRDFLQDEARRGQRAIAAENFEAIIVMRAEKGGSCESSYYVDYSA